MNTAVLWILTWILPFASFQEPDPLAKEAAKDIELGKEYTAELDKTLKFTENKEYIERVERIGQSLAKVANEYHIEATYGDKRHFKFDYTFKVIEDKNVNAFSVPGGFIYVDTGLLNFVESDDELAAVLAHEIAHAANRHMITILRERSKVNMWTVPLVIAALLSRTREAAAAAITGQLVQEALTSGWSQQAELDADRAGFFYLTHSSYNPVAMLTVLERLEYRERFGPKQELGIERTHPPSFLRLDAIRKMLKEKNLPIARSKVTTTFRAKYLLSEAGIIVSFGKRELFRLRGESAEQRAKEAIEKLNEFFDSSPHLFEVSVKEARVLGKGKTLVEFLPEDSKPGLNPESLAKSASDAIKNALFSLSVRTGG